MIVESRKEYIDNLPKGLPIYFQPDFLEAVDSNWTAFVGKNDKTGVPEWLLPCSSRKKFGIRLYAPAFLAHDNAVIPLVENIQDKTLSLPGFLSRTIINDRHSRAPQKLLLDFVKTERSRQVIDMENYPEEASDLKKSKYKNLRKADMCKVILTEDFNLFYKLYQSSFERQGAKLMSYGELHAVFQNISGAFESKLFILMDEKENLLSANWVAGYEDTIYGLLAAKNYEINRRGAQEYIMWELIQNMRETYKYWDLGGSNMPGVKQFNMEMGGENIQYASYVRYNPGWLGKLMGLLGK